MPNPPDPRFIRPIAWQNDDPDFPFSVGASACMVRFEGELFVVSAKHALERPQDRRTLNEAFIIQRLDSKWRVGLPQASEITPIAGSNGSVVNCDIQICTVQLNSNDEEGIGEEDFIEMGDVDDVGYAEGPSFLIGYPNHSQRIDYDKGISFREALIARGEISDDHPDDGVLWFNSPTASQEDINGMSGGAVASYCDEEGWRLEGICISGSGRNSASRAGFIGRVYLLRQIKEFSELVKLTS